MNELATSKYDNQKNKTHAAELILHICLEAAPVAQPAHGYSRLQDTAEGEMVTFVQYSSCPVDK